MSGTTFTMKVQVTRTLKRVVKLRYEDGILKVVANCFVSNKRLRQIIEENAEWINRQKQEQANLVSTNDDEPSKHSKTQKKVSKSKPTNENNVEKDIFAGRKTVIMGDVVKVASSVSSKTYLDGDVLYIAEKYFESREGRLKAIKAYLKKMAMLYVAGEIANFGSNVSLCPAKIEFKDNVDFWVKCSLAAQRILCFDIRIVQLPQNLRLYVIAHAFAHFSNPIHDDKFWNYVSNVLPRYQDYAKQLEKYQLLKDI